MFDWHFLRLPKRVSHNFVDILVVIRMIFLKLRRLLVIANRSVQQCLKTCNWTEFGQNSALFARLTSDLLIQADDFDCFRYD